MSTKNNNNTETNNIPIVFIHGIKGSTIVDEHDRIYYLNFWQGIGLSNPQIALPMEWKGK